MHGDHVCQRCDVVNVFLNAFLGGYHTLLQNLSHSASPKSSRKAAQLSLKSKPLAVSLCPLDGLKTNKPSNMVTELRCRPMVNSVH